ncbi:YugN-like family protein [Bacillus smithii]|uniref:YugN-like family protein n=1 Tax=Bacillus smithii TaxID=1479 RepID=UPI0030C8D684
MIQIPSKIEGRHYSLYKLEQSLKPKGFQIGGNWDYDHGSFDYKISDEEGYQFLRIPFTAVDGQLDSAGATVKLGRPFLMNHVYQRGLDDNASSGNLAASFNQFSEPQEKDAEFPEEYIQFGKQLVRDIESLLID